jgi:hypothetical protein
LATTPGDALYRLLKGPDAPDHVQSRLDAFTSGVEFGLAVAAAILSNGHDTNAASIAVEAELKANPFLAEQLKEAA